jgi:arylsulfatase
MKFPTGFKKAMAWTLGFAVPAGPAVAQDMLPCLEQPFTGHIGLTAKESTKDFPKEVQAPKGAPNILLILTDDVGFGASSTFGDVIPTPALDRVAKMGLRYMQFDSTVGGIPRR